MTVFVTSHIHVPTSESLVAEVLGVADADVGVHDGGGSLPDRGVGHPALAEEVDKVKGDVDNHGDADGDHGDEDESLCGRQSFG